MRSHRYEEAVEVCREAIRVNPENQYLPLVLGASLTEIGHLDEAIDGLQSLTAVEHPSYSWQVGLILTESLRKNDQYIESLRVFENVHPLHENPIFSYHIQEQTFLMAVVALKVANRESQYVNFERQGDWPRVYLQNVPEKKTAKNRLHIDIAVKDVDAAATWVEELGGSKLQTVEERGTRWTVMADLDGNEFCLVTEEE